MRMAVLMPAREVNFTYPFIKVLAVRGTFFLKKRK